MRPVTKRPDPRPSRRGRWALVAVAGLLAAVAVLALTRPQPRVAAATPGPPPAPDGPSPPAGFAVAGAGSEGFRVFLPGAVTGERKVRKSVTPAGVVVADPATEHWLFTSARGKEVSAAAYSIRRASAADDLWAELVRQEPLATSPALKLEAKTTATLGGRPALEVRLVENANWLHEHHPDEVPEPQGRIKDALDERQKAAQRWVYHVTADDRRVYIVRLETPGRYADPELLGTVTASFQFLP